MNLLRKKNKKVRQRRAGIKLNVKVNRSRHIKRFFSSSFFKKAIVLLCFSVLGVFGTILFTVGLEAFFKDPRYQINSITIYNQNFFTKQEILDMSGLVPGMYWFDFSVERAAQEIEKNPNVKKAEVERDLPNRVVIKVVERQPMARIKWGKKVFLIDEEGVILPTRAQLSDALVWITGCKVSEEQIGQKAVSLNLQRALRLLQAYSQVDLPLGMEMTEIAVSNNLVVKTRSSVQLVFGAGDYSEKLSHLNLVLKDLETRSQTAKVIDLRFKDVVVRPILARASWPEDKPVLRMERR